MDDGYDDPNFEHKFDLVTDGAHPFVKDHLMTRISQFFKYSEKRDIGGGKLVYYSRAKVP